MRDRDWTRRAECFVPALAAVELEPTTLVRTRALATRRGPRIEIVPGAMGVLVHEATHADDGEGQRPDVRKSGAPIPTSTIHRILRNRIYTGNFHWHGRLHEIAIGGRVA